MLRFRFVSENLQFVADFRRCGGGVYAPNAPSCQSLMPLDPPVIAPRFGPGAGSVVLSRFTKKIIAADKK